MARLWSPFSLTESLTAGECSPGVEHKMEPGTGDEIDTGVRGVTGSCDQPAERPLFGQLLDDGNRANHGQGPSKAAEASAAQNIDVLCCTHTDASGMASSRSFGMMSSPARQSP